MNVRFFVIAVALLAGGMMLALNAVAESTQELDIDGPVTEALADPVFRDALEQECIDVLAEKDSSWAAQHRAVRVLAAIGTRRSIEPVAALLTDPDWSHLARYVLEPMPYSEVDGALRDALSETTGTVRIGIIASLGHREDSQAVAPLAELLSADRETATSAALALGNIGTIEAADALETALNTDDSAVRQAAAEGSLVAAEKLMAGPAVQRGEALFEALQDMSWPDHIRAGAFSGLLRADSAQAPDRVMAALEGDDELYQAIAVAAVSTLEGDDVTGRFVAALDMLSGSLQASLLAALVAREDRLPLDVLHDALGWDSEATRVTAIQALSEQGDVSSVDALAAMLEQDAISRSERQAVLESLRRISVSNAGEAVIAAMQAAPERIRGELIEVVAQRRSPGAWEAVLEQTGNPALRPDAFRALGQLAEPEQLPELLSLLANLDGDAGRSALEESIVALCRRIADTGGELEIEHARYGDLPDGDWEDVTELVAERMDGSSPSIPAENRIFGDPAPGFVKRLRVDYLANGMPGSQTVREGETLTVSMDSLPADLVATLDNALRDADSPAETSSLLRVISGLGGPAAFELVLARTDDGNATVRDAAVRALADWPDVLAVDALADIFESTSILPHRVLALRGSVRLLRQEELAPEDTLAVYDRLIAAAQTADERRLILSGLADIAHPGAWMAVQAFIDDAEVQAEAALAMERIEGALPPGALFSERDGVEPIFDGETLEGWAGESHLWRVEDGHLIGETTEDNPLESNTFLIWEGGEPADFELTFRYRIDSDWANSGVQIRSERPYGYVVRGYQPDIATDGWVTGICFEEGGRGVLARRGQKVEFDADGEQSESRFAEEDDLGEHIHLRDWNDYRIVAQGPRIVSYINGHKMHEVIDHSPQAKRNGIIGFQLHTGPAMQIRFADIALERLPSVDE